MVQFRNSNYISRHLHGERVLTIESINSEKLWIEVIPSWAAKPFILHIHYARRMPCVKYAFGLFKDAELIGVCTYGPPATPFLCKGIAGEENKKNVLELNRLVIAPEYNGGNYASYLVSHSLKQLPNGTFVVSYADCGWGHVGYVYQATNWIYTGATKPRTDIVSVSGGHARHYKKGDTKRQPRSAKHRYVYLVGDKRTRKRMREQLRYQQIVPYPKGDSIHYDPNNPQEPNQ